MAASFEQLMLQQAYLHDEIDKSHQLEMRELMEEVRRLKAHLNFHLVSARTKSTKSLEKGDRRSSDNSNNSSERSSESCGEADVKPPPSLVVVPEPAFGHAPEIPGKVCGIDDESCNGIETLPSHVVSISRDSEHNLASTSDATIHLPTVESQRAPDGFTGIMPRVPTLEDPPPPLTSPAMMDSVRKAALALPGLTSTPGGERRRSTLARVHLNSNDLIPKSPTGSRRTSMVSLARLDTDKRDTVSHSGTNPAISVESFEAWPVWYDVIEFANIDKDDSKADNIHRRRQSRLEQMRKMAKSVDFHNIEHMHSPIFKCMQGMVLHPSSPKRLAWVCVGMGLIIYDMVMLPMTAFDVPIDDLSIVMSWIIAIFWMFDCIANFFVGFHVRGSSLEMRVRKTAAHYLRSWFVVDLGLVAIDFAIIITDLINTQQGGRSSASSVRIIKSVRTMRTLRSIRLLRIVKFPHIFKEITMSFGRSEYTNLCLGIVKQIFSIVILNHIVACLWYLIGKENRSGWVSFYMDDDEHWDMLYLTSLHWSLTQFTPASMDVQPQTLGERLFAVCVIVFALITFSSFVSSITNLMTHLRSLRSVEAKQFAKLERYLTDRKISFHLSLRVRRFLEHMVHESKTRLREQDVELIARLSEPLRMELHYEVYGPVVSKHPFFTNYAALNLPAMQKLCHTSIHSPSLSIDDMLFNVGETAKSIYFLIAGSLEYVRWDGKCNRVSEVVEGDWASEMVLWTPWEHRGSMKAKMQCALVSILATDFHKVVNETKAGQLEASAFAIRACEILKQLQISALSDLDGGEFDTHHICSEVFPNCVNPHHSHWYWGANRMSRTSFHAADDCRNSHTSNGFRKEGNYTGTSPPTSSANKPAVSFARCNSDGENISDNADSDAETSP